ncbi:hypothetical protein ACHWQZ_G018528 [Mnemiopsis leidyi]
MLQGLLEKKDLQLIFVLLVGLGFAADVPGDWTSVQRGIGIPLDLENTPLEIKTNSTLGSGDEVWVYFYTTQREYVGGVWIDFSPTTQYYLYGCSFPVNNFPTNLPVEVNKVWRITVDKTAGIRVKIHCNGVEVLNVLLSDTCSNIVWREYWSRDVELIEFSSYYDTASNYYRAGQTDCPGLKTEWESKLDTTTQFPVNPGTVVEVTCSDSGAINTGSSEVTCTSGRLFTFQQEPNCSNPGGRMYKYTYTPVTVKDWRIRDLNPRLPAWEPRRKPLHHQPIMRRKPLHHQPIKRRKPLHHQPIKIRKPLHHQPIKRRKPLHQQPIKRRKPLHHQPIICIMITKDETCARSRARSMKDVLPITEILPGTEDRVGKQTGNNNTVPSKSRDCGGSDVF